MKYEELIEEARDYFLPGDEPSVEYRTVEALESVVKENEALREAIDYLLTHRPIDPTINAARRFDGPVALQREIERLIGEGAFG